MEPTEAYEVLCYVPVRTLPYNQPGTCYTLVALPKEDPTAGELISRYSQDQNELASLCTSHLFLIKNFNSLISVLRKKVEWLNSGYFSFSPHRRLMGISIAIPIHR